MDVVTHSPWNRPVALAILLAATTALGGQNPVLKGADPHAQVVGKTVWIYPTTAAGEFNAFSSTNLRDWVKTGPVLRLADVSWITDDGAPAHYAWAPALAEKSKKFYFYYSVGPQNPTPSRIGVAVGDSPAGPFKDSGKPLLTGGNGFEAIDPMVFTDPKSKKSYLYAGGSAGAKLRVFEMNPDMVTFKQEILVETAPQFTEGAFMHERKGTYYFSYSHGFYRDHTYSVHYATAKSPVGPWTYRGAILESDDRHKGPGHHSFFRLGNRWLIAYHLWNNRTGNGPYDGSRETAIGEVKYRKDGTIAPVVMTDEVPKP